MSSHPSRGEFFFHGIGASQSPAKSRREAKKPQIKILTRRKKPATEFWGLERVNFIFQNTLTKFVHESPYITLRFVFLGVESRPKRAMVFFAMRTIFLCKCYKKR